LSTVPVENDLLLDALMLLMLFVGTLTYLELQLFS
jgi:hypothetical protein